MHLSVLAAGQPRSCQDSCSAAAAATCSAALDAKSVCSSQCLCSGCCLKEDPGGLYSTRSSSLTAFCRFPGHVLWRLPNKRIQEGYASICTSSRQATQLLAGLYSTRSSSLRAFLQFTVFQGMY